MQVGPQLAGGGGPDPDRVGHAAGRGDQIAAGQRHRGMDAAVVAGLGADGLAAGQVVDLRPVRGAAAIAAGHRQQRVALGEGQRVGAVVLLRQRCDQRAGRSVAQLQPAVLAGDGQPVAVRGYRQCGQRKVPQRLAVGNVDRRAAGAVPQPKTVVEGRRHQPGAAGGIGQMADPVAFAVEPLQRLGRLAERMRPAPDHAALSRRRQLVAGRVVGQGVDHQIRPVQHPGQLSRSCVEDADVAERRLGRQMLAEIARGGDEAAVARQRQRVDQPFRSRADLAAEGGGAGAGLPVPGADGLVVGGGVERGAVRADRQRADGGAVAAGVEVELVVGRILGAAGMGQRQRQQNRPSDPSEMTHRPHSHSPRRYPSVRPGEKEPGPYQAFDSALRAGKPGRWRGNCGCPTSDMGSSH